MPRADYEHWNEDADYMWWHEEGKHVEEPPEYDDDDGRDDGRWDDELAVHDTPADCIAQGDFSLKANDPYWRCDGCEGDHAFISHSTRGMVFIERPKQSSSNAR